MKTLKNYEAIYTRVFNWHKKYINSDNVPWVTGVSDFESDLIMAVVDEIKQRNGIGSIEEYKSAYREVLNWHTEYAFIKTGEESHEAVESLKKFESADNYEFVIALLDAVVNEIQSNCMEGKAVANM